MRRLALLVLCLAPHVLHAQGFRTFSGRNHPELDWQVARTEHFEIVYPAHLASIEAEAAAVAEASYDALSTNLGVTFDRPIRVYLSDEDEIANGVAFNVGPAGFTNVWVHVNETAEIWTGGAKWLRTVLAHEIAHIFHYRAIRSPLGALQNLVANPIPSFWAEGLAQYETEAWDAQRGDRWLRTAVFEDRLSYSDGLSPWNGRLRYAVGNSQVRYLAEQYGDSTLTQLLQHRKKLLPGVRVHDFYAAFEATVGLPYRRFYEAWRQHVNVYYNTLAGQMGRVDSLGAPLDLPGHFLYDVAYSPDTSKVAVLVLTSVARPVRRLAVIEGVGDTTRARRVDVVAEGALEGPAAWSPDGGRLAYARRVRGRYGSLVNDLYLYDLVTEKTRRLTENRRAVSPTFAPDGRRLAFVASEAGTANVYVLDLRSGEERRLTDFTGDVQLTTLRWSPDGGRLASARFGPRGERDVVVIDAATGAAEPVTVSGPETDDRLPVWSPDGRRLAFTSLRDDVPNVFVLDLEPEAPALPLSRSPVSLLPEERRVTYLFTGATAHDWLPPDSLHPDGRLVVVTSESKRRERAYALDARRTVAVETPAEAPAAYAGWTEHRPPATIPFQIEPEPALIERRYGYNSWANITHAATLALPYYDGPDDWGAFASTVWLEPLGKHLVVGLLSLSVPSPLEKTIGYLQYTNNQLRPSLSLSLYRYPSPARWYGSDLLVEDLAGGDLGVELPLDLTDRPFVRTSADARLRVAYADPFDADGFDVETTGLETPERGVRTEVRVGFTYRRQRPYRLNALYPLDGTGFRVRLTGGLPVFDGGAYVRPDVQAYAVTPGLGIGRFFVYGRAQAQFGEGLAQDVLGLARYDDIDLQLPFVEPITLSGIERVRGYRRYAVGDRVLFGTVEYRLPPVFDLRTRLLGFLGLGRVSPALFVDAGMVWSGSDVGDAVRRTGVGAEVKNLVRLGGFELVHALGVAQRWDLLGERVEWDDLDLYYRIQAVLPF